MNDKTEEAPKTAPTEQNAQQPPEQPHDDDQSGLQGLSIGES